MKQAPVIRDGGIQDLDVLVDTLSDAFKHDPVLNWLIPPVQLYPDYFRLLIEEVYLPRGLIHMEQSGRAAALWLPPEERFEVAPRLSLLRLGWQLFLHQGLHPLLRIRRQGLLFQQHLPLEPHYHLQFIGCHTLHQGKGVGCALLEHGTGICDEHAMPAYLESSNARNVPLYERHGFEVRNCLLVSDSGPQLWFMSRDPRR